jgi:Type I restriction modification DNA specificity domain
VLQLCKIAHIFTGVPVPNNISGSARFLRLSDLSNVKAGRAPILAEGEAPVVARAVTIEPGDIIIGARGSASDVCLAIGPFFGAYVSLDLYLIRPNSESVNPQYLAAFLRLPSTQALFASDKQGSSLARLPKEALEEVRVPLPPIRLQNFIAELAVLFEEEDRLLKKLAVLNSTLSQETIARAIHAGTQQIS